MFYFESVNDAFTNNEITKARRNYKLGHAMLHQVTVLPDDSGYVMDSVCQGSGKRPYTQKIELIREGNGWDVDSRCSCPMRYNCKHVACVLIAFEADQARAAVEKQIIGNDLENWIDAIPEPVEDIPQRSATADQLVYNLRQDTEQCWILTVYKNRKLKSGDYGRQKPKSMSINTLSNSVDAAYITPEDVEILGFLRASLFGAEYYYRHFRFANGDESSDGIEMKGEPAYLALVKSAACERLFIGPIQDYKALRLLEAQPLNPNWKITDAGQQTMQLHQSFNISGFIGSEPVLALAQDTAQLFPVQGDYSLESLMYLLAAPDITIEQGQKLEANSLKQLQQAGLPVPQKIKLKKLRRKTRAQVCLSLLNDDPSLGHFARLEFVYPQMSPVLSGTDGDYVSRCKDGELTQLPRNTELEQDAQLLLRGMGFMPAVEQIEDAPGAHQGSWLMADILQWHVFLTRGISDLESQGWQILKQDEFDLEFIQADDWYTDISEGPASQWFSLELGVEAAGGKINLLPVLLQAMQGYDLSERLQWMRDSPELDFPAQLETGQYIVLPVARVLPLLETFVELFDGPAALNDGRLLLPAVQAGRLDTISGDDWRWSGGEKLKRLALRLANFEGVQPVSVPGLFHGELRPYQQQGVNWLQFLRDYEFSGILADDMGLGKTVQTLAHLCVEKAAGRLTKPCLIVAPTSLVGNWKNEAAQFAPALSVVRLQGAERKQYFDHLNDYDIVLSTYPLLNFDGDVLHAQAYSYLILDEAQNIKNPRSKAARWVRECDAQQRLCLTGTPMENHLGELWSLYDFLMPGLLGDEKEFARQYRKPIENEGDSERHLALNKRVAPFLLRRTKQAVATELPAKTEISCSVALSGKQADLYETIRLSMHKKITSEVQKKGLARSHIMILDALLKLRQACCHPALVNLAAAKKIDQSAKLDMLMDMLPEMVEEGRKILVFSQFTSMLSVIEDQLNAHKISYSKLTGQTRKRDQAIAAFQQGDAAVFLISLKAGGLGLNLTAADTVIHYDPWWNPAVEDQATDRAYRIGQDKPVFVYKLTTENTVEEKILQMQQRKRVLAEGTYSNKSQQSVQISEQDLEDLFKPL